MTSGTVESESDRSVRDLLSAVFDLFPSSTSLLIAFGGIAMVGGGYYLQTGVWAAILPVWGTALAIIGITAYLISRWVNQ